VSLCFAISVSLGFVLSLTSWAVKVLRAFKGIPLNSFSPRSHQKAHYTLGERYKRVLVIAVSITWWTRGIILSALGNIQYCGSPRLLGWSSPSFVYGGAWYEMLQGEHQSKNYVILMSPWWVLGHHEVRDLKITVLRLLLFLRDFKGLGKQTIFFPFLSEVVNDSTCSKWSHCDWINMLRDSKKSYAVWSHPHGNAWKNFFKMPRYRVRKKNLSVSDSFPRILSRWLHLILNDYCTQFVSFIHAAGFKSHWGACKLLVENCQNARKWNERTVKFASTPPLLAYLGIDAY